MAATVQNNSVIRHVNQTTTSTSGCTNCHPRASSTMSDSSLQVTNDMHLTHSTSIHLTGAIKECNYCHKGVSVERKIASADGGRRDDTSVRFRQSNRLVDGTSMAGDLSSIATTDTYDHAGIQNGNPLRRIVTPVICNRCHGKFATTVHGGINYVNTNRYGCATTCHKTGGTARKAYDAHEDASAIGSGGWISATTSSNRYFCWLCHGGRDKFLTEESNKYDGSGNAYDEWMLDPPDNT